MKHSILLLALVGLFFGLGNAQNLQFYDLELKNVDGTTLKIADYKEQKAVVVIFSGIHCVYAKKYEDRILLLRKNYKAKGVQLIVVNSNDPAVSNEDSFERMGQHAIEKGYDFPYVADHQHELADLMGAEKNPEVFVLQAGEGGMKVLYQGPIDDNPLQADSVDRAYLNEVLDALLAGKPLPKIEDSVKGCGIKRMD